MQPPTKKHQVTNSYGGNDWTYAEDQEEPGTSSNTWNYRGAGYTNSWKNTKDTNQGSRIVGMKNEVEKLGGAFQLFKQGDDLESFKLVLEGLDERRQKTNSLDGNTMKFMMRQGGQYMDFKNRGEYLEYIAKIHAYVLPWMPKDAQIKVGRNVFRIGMIDYYQPNLNLRMIHESLFTAWESVRDVVWTMSLDYFGANANLCFQLVSVNPNEWGDDEEDSVVVKKMMALDMIRYYVAKCQDMKVRGTGSMWSYLVSHCLEGQQEGSIIPLMLFSGQLDLCMDGEEPYVKVVCTNLVQKRNQADGDVFWKSQEERFPMIEENVNVMKFHKAYNKKTQGYTYANSGPAMESLYRENADEPVHQNESIRMQAMEKIFAGGRRALANWKDDNANSRYSTNY